MIVFRCLFERLVSTVSGLALLVPCGQCLACRNRIVAGLAGRGILEAQSDEIIEIYLENRGLQVVRCDEVVSVVGKGSADERLNAHYLVDRKFAKASLDDWSYQAVNSQRGNISMLNQSMRTLTVADDALAWQLKTDRDLEGRIVSKYLEDARYQYARLMNVDQRKVRFRYMGGSELGTENKRWHLHIYFFGIPSFVPGRGHYDDPAWPHGVAFDSGLIADFKQLQYSIGHTERKVVVKGAGFRPRLFASLRPGIGMKMLFEFGAADALLHQSVKCARVVLPHSFKVMGKEYPLVNAGLKAWLRGFESNNGVFIPSVTEEMLHMHAMDLLADKDFRSDCSKRHKMVTDYHREFGNHGKV